VPIKKLHPRYQGEPEMPAEAEGKIIYTSEDPVDKNEDNIDPRWDKLRKLK
jgi:uncharacterized protein